MAGISPPALPGSSGGGGSSSIISLLGITTAGQKAMSGSLPVVIASDQSSLPVTLNAETTKVIGEVNQGTSPWIVSGAVASGVSDSGNPVKIGGKYNSTQPSFSDGQRGDMQLSSRGSVLVTPYTLNNGSTVDFYVDNADGVAVTSNQSSQPVISRNTVFNGTSWDRIRSGGATGSVMIGGSVATNVAITTNPINLGAQAVSSENTAITATRQAQLVSDLVGKLIVLPYANPENFVSGRATATDTTSTSLIGAPASGLRNYITQITVWNSSATSTYIKIQDGSGGTELYDIPAPAGGGATLTLPVPLRQPTTATAIFFAANASASAVFISASGYKGI